MAQKESPIAQAYPHLSQPNDKAKKKGNSIAQASSHHSHPPRDHDSQEIHN